jgi:hypothetical protein
VWKETIESSWTYVLQIFFELLSLAVMLFSIFRLSQFYEFNEGFRLNVPQVCLAFVIATTLSKSSFVFPFNSIFFNEIVKLCLLALIVGALDPLGIRRIFDNVTNNIFGTLPYILAATPYFILSLYW